MCVFCVCVCVLCVCVYIYMCGVCVVCVCMCVMCVYVCGVCMYISICQYMYAYVLDCDHSAAAMMISFTASARTT